MTTLLQRMQDDMKLRNLAASTQASYAQHVSMLTKHFDRSPETIAPEEIRSYQLYLSTEKKSAPATVAIAVSALRFLYGVTLQRSWVMEETLPMPKRPQALPVVLSPDEVVEFLECVPQAKHRAILMSPRWPLPCSMRITIRRVSMSPGFNRTTSDTRNPAA